MKLLILLSVMLSSQFAMADAFYCELEIGNEGTLINYAEYRGRSVTTQTKNGVFTCSATIDNNLIVKSTVVSRSTGHTYANSDEGMGRVSVSLDTLNETNDEEILVTCSCGLM